MLVLLYRLVCGYLYVRVTAEHPEKILNLCGTKGIGIWRVLLKNDRLYFKIGVHSFKKLRLYKRNIPGKIHITKKVGLPFFVARNRKRYGMAIGFVVFFFILQLLSGHVWNICISGNSTVKSEQIVSALQSIGITEGTPIAQIDPEEKRNELLLAESGLSWAAINIEGSKLTVDVVETKTAEQKEATPSNLKAAEEGVVQRMEVISGVTQVSLGEPVEKGQLLVSGVNEYADLSASLVRSQGKIYAEVEKTVTVVQPLAVTEDLRTGEIETNSVLRFFGLNIPLFLGNVPPPFESNATVREITAGESYLPIGLEQRTFYKTERTAYTLSEEQGKKRALKRLEKQLKKEVGDGEITKRQDHFSRNGNDLVLRCEITCIKDIAFEEKIQLDTRN